MHIIKSLLILTTMLFISACTTKTPFKVQEPLTDAALIYLIVTDTQSDMDDSMEDSKYKVQINGKNVRGTIEAGEYKVFDMKPETVLFTAVRRNIEQMHIKLKLVAGQTYYLKIQSAEFGGQYSFEQVNVSEAQKDLENSGLAGSFEMDMAAYVPDFAGSTAGENSANKIPAMSEAEIDAIIEKKLKAMNATQSTSVVAPTVAQSVPKSSSSSKLNDIKEAYNMKKQGLLSNEEFKAMKVEILAK